MYMMDRNMHRIWYTDFFHNRHGNLFDNWYIFNMMIVNVFGVHVIRDMYDNVFTAGIKKNWGKLAEIIYSFAA